MTEEELKMFVIFVATLCHNMYQDKSPAEYISGREDFVIGTFRDMKSDDDFVLTAWQAGSDICEGRA